MHSNKKLKSFWSYGLSIFNISYMFNQNFFIYFVTLLTTSSSLLSMISMTTQSITSMITWAVYSMSATVSAFSSEQALAAAHAQPAVSKVSAQN